MSDDPDDLVGGLAAAVGAEPGSRLLHARGTWVAAGTFRALSGAGALSTAAVFSGRRLAVTGRFSGARGGPRAHDAGTADQGLAVRMTLPGGHSMDLIALAQPVFFARTAAELVHLLATAPPPTPPDAPAGYLGQCYHSVHAFGLVNADNGTRWARLEWHPERETPRPTREEANTLPPDYLAGSLTGGLPARFTLHARFPAGGDTVHDPTARWAEPGDRTPLGELGIGRVLAVPPGPEPDFDPLNLPHGILPLRDRPARERSTFYRAARARRRAGG
ncbi:catalase [Streptomyces uncialis]|uniref:catalase n=1 Tax=Streptomyces uncialis TaxID=1048205 RepID=UPI003653F1AA